MEAIQKLGGILCGISLLSMLLSFLLPKAEISKTAASCAGVFFAAAMLLPILRSDFRIQLDFSAMQNQTQETMTQAIQSSTLTLAENAVSDQLYKELLQQGYAVSDLAVTLHISSDSSIRISSVELTADAASADAVSAYITQEYGVSPQMKEKKQ